MDLVNAPQLDDAGSRTLLEAWLARLTYDELGPASVQSGSGALRELKYVFEGDRCFAVRIDGSHVEIAEYRGVDEETAHRIVKESIAKVSAGDFGGHIPYRVDFEVVRFDFFDSMHFMRRISDRVAVTGARRLSDIVLLDFPETRSELNAIEALFAEGEPEAIQATIFVEGPIHSEFTLLQVRGVAETVAAICALATGEPLRYVPPMFDLEPDDAAEAEKRRFDPEILGLTRDGISLDIFIQLTQLGDVEAFQRVSGALLAYHAALKQESADVATMLLVTALESLCSQAAPWGRERVTTRFVKFLIDLCPEAIDHLLEHANLEMGFSYRPRGGPARRRRDLLEHIYDLRSRASHAGLSPSLDGVFGFASSSGVRVALIAELAQQALLNFIKAPRSSIVGYPAGATAGEE